MKPDLTGLSPDVQRALKGWKPQGHLGDGDLWSYITGVRGLNRIRVYERRPGGALYYEWYDQNGRHQKSLEDVSGQPVTHKTLAMWYADQMAEGQARKRHSESARSFLGLPEHHTLGDLLDRYHEDHPHWSAGHMKNQRVNRRFWLRHFGADTLLTDVTPAKAKKAIRDESEVNANFGSRTQEKRLRYLMDAFSYACEQLKWIEPKDDLKGLKSTTRKLGSKKSRKSYTEEEVAALLPASEKIGLRVAVFAHIAWNTGRRPKAIHALRTEHYRQEDDYGVLTFVEEHDKTGQPGEAYLYGRSKALVETLLEQPAVQNSGWLFPTGELDDASVEDRVSDQWLRVQWEDVEALAGVDHHKGRSFYGLKRRFVTSAVRKDEQAARWQSGVTTATMRQIYEQDDAGPKRELARHMAELVNGEDVKVPPVKVPDAFGRSRETSKEE